MTVRLVEEIPSVSPVPPVDDVQDLRPHGYMSPPPIFPLPSYASALVRKGRPNLGPYSGVGAGVGGVGSGGGIGDGPCQVITLDLFVYYESIKRDPKIRGIYECRCDKRLQTKTKKFTRLPYTGLVS